MCFTRKQAEESENLSTKISKKEIARYFFGELSNEKEDLIKMAAETLALNSIEVH